LFALMCRLGAGHPVGLGATRKKTVTTSGVLPRAEDYLDLATSTSSFPGNLGGPPMLWPCP
ncbi:hypothetical protein E2562_016468, partial [Oryza meyeriana var. granulata]